MTPEERLARLASGEDPALILRMASGFAVMGHTQFLPGYCLLLAYPQVEQLGTLELDARLQFLRDMALLGEAVQAATTCVRVNYSIYGNLDPFLHAHVWPRYRDEEVRFRTLPPLSIPLEVREAEGARYDSVVHRELQERLLRELRARLGVET